MNTIRALCSHCGHEMQLPATLAGKQGKCPACGQLIEIIAVTDSVEMHSPMQPPTPQPLPQQPAPAQTFTQNPPPAQPFPQQTLAQGSNVRDQAKETAKLAGATAKALGGMIYEQAKKGARASKKSKFGGFSGAKSSQAVGNTRYPNLTKYLEIMEILIRVIFMINLVILAVCVIAGIGFGLYAMIVGIGRGTEAFLIGLAFLVGTPIA